MKRLCWVELSKQKLIKLIIPEITKYQKENQKTKQKSVDKMIIEN